MIQTSIILPSFKEPYLNKTIDSILENSVTSIEIIPVIDAYEPAEPVRTGTNITTVYHKENKGMRGSINSGLAVAQGKFVMKLDSHCIVAPGFDKVLSEDCKENWLMIPRRYSVNEEKWEVDKKRYARDYHYFTFPEESGWGKAIFIGEWTGMDKARKDPKFNIDSTMAFQGSAWFANRKYFMTHVGFLDDSPETYGSIAEDQLEIGLKYWLNGGEVKVDKNTWYAHLAKRGWHYQKRIFDRIHKRDAQYVKSSEWATKRWMNNEEPDMKEPFEYLINKFWPIPTWMPDWKQRWQQI